MELTKLKNNIEFDYLIDTIKMIEEVNNNILIYEQQQTISEKLLKFFIPKKSKYYYICFSYAWMLSTINEQHFWNKLIQDIIIQPYFYDGIEIHLKTKEIPLPDWIITWKYYYLI